MSNNTPAISSAPSDLEITYGDANTIEIQSKSGDSTQEMTRVSAYVFDDEMANRLMNLTPENIKQDASILKLPALKAIVLWTSRLLGSTLTWAF